jgi:hypothetical protein
MKTIFWIPKHPVNLIKLIFHFDKRPLIYCCFEPKKRPSYVIKALIESVHTRINGTFKYFLIQPLDRKSLYFLLDHWDCLDNLIIFSSDSNLDRVVPALRDHRKDDQRLYPYPDAIMNRITGHSGFSVFPRAIFDVDRGVLIASDDLGLLSHIFSYLVSLGEPGFVFDGSPAAEISLRDMKLENAGLYIDDYANIANRWTPGEQVPS